MKDLGTAFCRRLALVVSATAGLLVSLPAWGQPHLIEVLADKDSRYKMAGQAKAEITVKAGEPILLRVNARKGKSWNRDGSVHGFTVLEMHSRNKVPGWDHERRPGTNEFTLTAPAQPGEYEVLCTVICSDDHEGMRMKFHVVP